MWSQKEIFGSGDVPIFDTLPSFRRLGVAFLATVFGEIEPSFHLAQA